MVHRNMMLITVVATAMLLVLEPQTMAQALGNNVVMVIVDDSGSVMSSDSSARRFQLAEAIIDALDDADLVNIVRFATTAQALFPSWTLVAGQRKALKAALRTPLALGSATDVQAALALTLPQFAAVANLKRPGLVFLISDGQFEITEMLERLLARFKSAGIAIYTLSVRAGEDPLRLQTVATLAGGAYLPELSPTVLKRILRPEPSLRETTPFPWAEVTSRLRLELQSQKQVSESEPISFQATVWLDGRPLADEQALTTPWGAVTLSVRGVQLAINRQLVGEMTRAGRDFRLVLPSLRPGSHHVQATATVLLRSGEAEQAVTLLSPELSVGVEASTPPSPESVPQTTLPPQIIGLALGALMGLTLIVVPVARRLRQRRHTLRPGQELSFSKSRVTIGSAPENDLVVHGSGIGEVHLEIQQEPDGTFRIKDESGLGVDVNGKAMRWGDLRHGDLIGFGPYKMEFFVMDDGFKLKVLNNPS
uniref:FHA domain-containing protein n=1 Tax=uncultured prokaryote TaxID=198431 RepID=H5S949_9ZZZZ|nr:hypothetical protein HGMM_F03A04C08 [uncultured prokaryote]